MVETLNQCEFTSTEAFHYLTFYNPFMFIVIQRHMGAQTQVMLVRLVPNDHCVTIYREKYWQC